MILSVRDTGCGMDQKLVERIFEPYFTTKEKGKGTGMGLAVVHGIVSAHQGAIRVESKVDQGTIVEVLLPMVEDAADTIFDRSDEQEQLPGGSEHILLVDDEQIVLDVNSEILRTLGYRITSATSSLEALELFSSPEADFDLVFTDLTMPEMTGIELGRQILQSNPTMPIILCTGYNDKVGRDEVLAMGIREYLSKPLSAREIATTIRRLLDE
jgi:CheY-like chemotaxis protein